MEQKILNFEKNEDRYLRLADKCIEREDFSGALAYLFNALNLNRKPDTLMDIADLYSRMGLYELSNKYWFYYIELAPKDKVSVAYEELAINFFYMDDFLTSSFYLHQKLAVDGFLSKEGMDKEMIDFFSGEEMKKNAYYVAYPFDKADYSYTVKRAKRALSSGNYLEAVKLFKSIPVECLDEDSAGDLSVSYLMNDEPDTAIAVARDSLAKFGENLTAYCNLSNAYDFKEDFQKSEYYYQKALSVAKGEKNEEFKLATCAIERDDHITVKKCLEKILTERKYEATMQFFYGLSQLNLGEFDGARKTLSSVYRIDPTDKVFKFYAEYAEKLSNGGSREYLPVKYLKNLPQCLVENYEKKLDALSVVTNKKAVNLRKEEFKNIVEWGLYSAEETARKSVFVLACDYSPYAKKLLKEYLMDSEGLTPIKQVIVYALTVNGLKEKLNIVDRNFFFSIKPKKLRFESDKSCELYVCAYALAFSRMAFLGVENLDALAKAINGIYAKFFDKLGKGDVTIEELASLAVYLCRFPRFQTEKEIMRVFEITKEKLIQLANLYKGEKND